MNLSPAKTIEQFKEFWGKQAAGRRRLLIAVPSAILILSIVLAILLNHTSYTILYTGLSSDEAGEILDLLDEMSVQTKTSDDNTILVPKGEESRLKMQLAAKGYPRTAQNYDLFSQNVDFMTTDYEKRQYLIFQLQNRLQEAIQTLDGVKAAIVTISVPEDDSYVLSTDATPATASVVLDLERNTELDKRQISGIEYLVANSVPGLDCSNVAIIDSNASLLNSQDADAALSSDRLSLEETINQTVENKVLKLLQPIFGYGKIRVAANTVVDLSQKVSQETKYTPTVGDNGMVSSQDVTQENGSGTDAASGVPGTDSNTGTSYPEAGSGAEGGTVSASSSTQYLVNEYTEQVQRNGYEIQTMSVSVMIGDPGLSDDDLQKYRQAVAYASGIPEEQVLITAVQFAESTASDIGSSSGENTGVELLTLVKEKPLYFAIGAAVLIAGLVVLLLLTRKARAKRHHGETDEPDELRRLLDPQTSNEPMPGEIVLNETRGQALKRQIKEFSVGNPEIVAQLLRTWLKEEQ
ncbi:MAG: flagellar basal-body MS-ring/collar protein FliF [Clostridiaceae bacterium]|nr:flagellar basal-body MS-ring/collar protein FliF [Clostridiaceae bacterium]